MKQKQRQGMSKQEIMRYVGDNPDVILCHECKGLCHLESPYQTFTKSPRECLAALLCEKVHVPPLDLPSIDENLRAIDGETDKCFLYQEKCCYGNHCKFEKTADGETKSRSICGWDGIFRDMPIHRSVEVDEHTSEDIVHQINACPDDYNRPGLVTWMEFQKVARSNGESAGGDDDGNYGSKNEVTTQIEWLPVEGYVLKFFNHVRSKIEAYAEHDYEVRLMNRTRKCEERAFVIDPATREDCPEEFKNVASEVVDFSSAISSKRKHDLMCAFPETHNCEVHHVTFRPKFKTVDEIEKQHKRTANQLRKR